MEKIIKWLSVCQEKINKFIQLKSITFYKYQKFDETSFLNVINGLIKISNPKTFNDVYDGDLLAGKYYPFTNKENSNIIGDTTRIASFSEDSLSIPMWAYYANNNKGICYCYNISQLNDYYMKNPFAGIFPVIYEKEPTDITQLLLHSTDSNIIKLRELAIAFRIICKSDVWSHEKELRLCFQLTDNEKTKIKGYGTSLELYEFMKPESIILGAKFDMANISFIRKYFKGNIYQIEPAPKAYKLEMLQLF